METAAVEAAADELYDTMPEPALEFGFFDEEDSAEAAAAAQLGVEAAEEGAAGAKEAAPEPELEQAVVEPEPQPQPEA